MGGAFAAGLKRQHTIVLNAIGNYGAVNTPGSPAIDIAKLKDILLVVKYHL